MALILLKSIKIDFKIIYLYNTNINGISNL